jgi:Protein of unknown function (DUF1573)
MWHLVFILFFVGNQTEKVAWISPKTYSFGEIQRGIPVKTDFKFKNVAGEPILIDAVRTTCGCTAANFPDIPVEINQTDVISIEFNAKKVGFFSKKIKVYFDGQRKPEILTIEGEVL